MKINAFTKTYGKKKVLSFPGMELPDSGVTAVIGANGSGKSTFARIIAGIEPSDQESRPLAGVSVGYLPQKSYGFRMSVRANLLLNGGDEARAERYLDTLKIRSLEKARADRLSGGETARMALARILMNRYDLVILDEPTASMDMESTLLAEQLIKEYVREMNCAVLLVTHSLQQARRTADDVLFLSAGELIENGPITAVLSAPEKDETRRFLEFYGFSPEDRT